MTGHASALPFWQRLTPKTRLICTIAAVFAIALTPNGEWWTWLVYGVGVLSLLLLTRINLWPLLRRVAIEFLFIGVALLGCLFQPEGMVLWQWGWVRITTVGVMILGSVLLKALLSLLLLNFLTQTTPIPQLLHALAALRVPPLLVAILAAMYRYLSVLQAEVESMRRAALSRNLMNQSRWQRFVVGQMIGSLFLRSLERGERIYQAMLSRGYTGLPPLMDVPRTCRLDYLALMSMTFLLLLGQAVRLL